MYYTVLGWGKIIIVDSKYLRCGFVLSVTFTYLCGVGSGKNKNYFVPEVPSAKPESKRYSNEARCFGTRCCVGPEEGAAC